MKNYRLFLNNGGFSLTVAVSHGREVVACTITTPEEFCLLTVYCY
jgi:hypothetical protein